MSNSFFNHSEPVAAGSTIRAAKYNSDFQGIETGFENVEYSLGYCIKFPASFTGESAIPEKTLTNSMIYINVDGDVDVYSMDDFDQKVLDVANNAQAAQDSATDAQDQAVLSNSYKQQSQQYAIAAGESETNAGTSEQNAAQSAQDSLTYSQNSYNSSVVSGQARDESITAKDASEAAMLAAMQSETLTAIDAASTAEDRQVIELLYDELGDQYLGPKDEDPTTDNDGDPLQIGANYWHITLKQRRFWNGVAFESPEATASQAATAAVNAAQSVAIAEVEVENDRQQAETAALTSGNHATDSENARLASESARNESVAAKDYIEGIDIDAKVTLAQDGAVRAQNSANDSYSERLLSEQARQASVDAQELSETARDETVTIETAVANHAAQVALHRTAIEDFFNQYGDRYLGAKSADPTLDNDSNPLQTGMVYYNDVADESRVWNGISWELPDTAASTAASNALLSEQNTAQHELDTINAKEAAESARDASLDAQTATEDVRDEVLQTQSLVSGLASQVAFDKQAVDNIFNQYLDLHLGAFTEDPVLNNEGGALVSGNSYWNTNYNQLRFYNGSVWDKPDVIATQAANDAAYSQAQSANHATASEGFYQAAELAKNAAIVAQEATEDAATQVAEDKALTENYKNQTIAALSSVSVSTITHTNQPGGTATRTAQEEHYVHSNGVDVAWQIDNSTFSIGDRQIFSNSGDQLITITTSTGNIYLNQSNFDTSVSFSLKLLLVLEKSANDRWDAFLIKAA